MKVAADTSVLVAALHSGHEWHARARHWIEAVSRKEIDGLITTHALAETWATLSRLPLRPRVQPRQAADLVEQLHRVFAVISLDPSHYRAAIERCVNQGVSSGAVFDALHLMAAEREGAERLLTFNARDFDRLALASSPRIHVPTGPDEAFTA